jgi:hypothetical protein
MENFQAARKPSQRLKGFRSYAKERNRNAFPEFVYIRTPEKCQFLGWHMALFLAKVYIWINR